MLFLGLFSCKNEISGQAKGKDIETQFKKDSGILVDVRTLDEWNEGHHKKAIHSDWNSGEFKEQSKNWDPSKAYYLHCAAGVRAGKAADYLKSKGFKKVYNLGGYDDVKNLKLE
jgi:phage shock protein E